MNNNIRQLKELTKRLNDKDQQIKQEKENYESLVEMLPEIIFVHRDGNILFVNQRGVHLLGYEKKSEIVNKSIFDFIVGDLSISEIENITRTKNLVCNTNEYISLEMLRKDKTILFGEAGSSKVMWEGIPAIQSVIRDLTSFNAIQKRMIRLQYDDELHDSGQINHLSISPNRSYLLSEGWTLKLIDVSKGRDVFEAIGSRGKDIREHSHRQKEFIEVINGEIIVFLRNKTLTAKFGEKIEIEPFEKHKITALSDCKLKVTFIPPISI